MCQDCFVTFIVIIYFASTWGVGGGGGGGGGAGLQASVHLNLYCQDMYVYA